MHDGLIFNVRGCHGPCSRGSTSIAGKRERLSTLLTYASYLVDRHAGRWAGIYCQNTLNIVFLFMKQEL